MQKRIAVIGGGIAGLSAASALVRDGCAVTVFEARERFGGRVHTIQHGTLPIELGGEFLHGESETVLNAIRAAGLTTHEVPERNRLFEDKKFSKVDIWRRVGKIIHKIDPKKPDASFLEFIDTQSLSELDRKLAISFVQGFHASYVDKIGIHGLLRGQYAADQMAGSEQGRINEGYSALVTFFENDVRQHGGKLLTKAQVRSVQWARGKVTLKVQTKPAKNTIAAGDNTFDAALITLPLGVLKARTVKFDPPLNAKRDAINGLEFGKVVKITLVFKEQWWPDDFGFVHAHDEPIPTWWTDPRGPIMTGWTGGPKADALAEKTPAELESLALRILQKFSKRPLALRARLAASYTYDWQSDPHAHGAYSYIPVNGLDLPKLLAAPLDDTLFFAGEATVNDAQMGTVFGAYESGLRAAREILRQF